jgi:hypothetical protein
MIHPDTPGSEHEPNRRGHHSWMMVACCVPMVAIAVVLVALGAISIGFLLVVVACVALMALMMRGMSHE